MVIQLPSSIHPQAAAAINSVLAAYDTENLRHALATYPSRIKNQRDAVGIARKAWRDTEQQRATLEAEILLFIGTETDDKGKTKYTNAESRAAELLRRKGTDPAYQETLAVVSDAEAELNEAQDTLLMLLDEYQSARIAARLIAAEMSVLSELIDVGEADEVSTAGVMQVEIPDPAAPTGAGQTFPRSHRPASQPLSKEAF